MVVTISGLSADWLVVTVRGRSWGGGSSRDRRRSWRSLRPLAVMVSPRPGRARPHQGEAAGLAGQPADDLDPPSRLAEGAFDEVGVPYAVMALGREAQVGGQALPVGGQALHR